MEPLSLEISRISRVYERYINKTDEIEVFVQIAENQKGFVETIEVPPIHQSYINGLKQLNNSVVLYNAAIISIYGSYELFIDEVLKAYIEYLKERNTSYLAFPKKLKEKHLSKSAEYLSNPQRFLKMGLEDKKVIRALADSCVEDDSSALIDNLLLAHGGNLNTKQLKNLLIDFGFDNPIDCLAKHVDFKKFCESYRIKNGFSDSNDNAEISDEGFYYLDTIVEHRNKVSHGWIIDDRISFSLLKNEYLQFFRSMCNATKDLIISQIIQDYINDNTIKQFGPILNTWQNGRIIGINSQNFRLRTHEYLYYSTDDKWNYPFKIINLQNDKQDRKEIRAINKDITIETNLKIKKNYTIWGYTK